MREEKAQKTLEKKIRRENKRIAAREELTRKKAQKAAEKDVKKAQKARETEKRKTEVEMKYIERA